MTGTPHSVPLRFRTATTPGASSSVTVDKEPPMAIPGFRRALTPVLAMILLPMAAGVSGCAFVCGASGAASAPLETRVLNVAAVPSVDSAGFFVALHDGLFAQQGLTIRYTPATSSDTVIDDQFKGTYDITAGNYVSYVEHVAFERQPLEIVAEGSLMQQGSQAIYTLPGSPIKTMQQLRGQLIGTNAPKNINYLLAASVLTESGIPLTDVRFTNAPIPFPDLITDLH